MPITTSIITLNTHSKTADWQRILADSYKKPLALLRDLDLADDTDVSADVLFATRVPRPFVEKMQRGNPRDPLLLQVLPHSDEFAVVEGFSNDPLHEKQFNPLTGLLHKYHSRVLLTLRGACAINCRYCFRRHFDYADNRVNKSQLDAIIDYITTNPGVNEVILSGGDPLMSKDSDIDSLLSRLEDLPQLKRVRFHTRLPVVIPERITDNFAIRLGKSRLRSIVVLHCNHPNEIDENFNVHVKKLIDNDVVVLNQSVLLKDINDDAAVLVGLSEKLFAARIMPYYLFLLDKVTGASHFEIDETRAKQIIREVASQLPGYLVPTLTRETAGLKSKDMWVG